MTEFELPLDGAALIRHENEIIEKEERIINENSALLKTARKQDEIDLSMEQLVHAHEEVVNERESRLYNSGLKHASYGSDASNVQESITPSEFSSSVLPRGSENTNFNTTDPTSNMWQDPESVSSVPEPLPTKDQQLIQHIIKEWHPGSLPRFETKADIYNMELEAPSSNTARKMLVEDSMRKYERFKQKKPETAEIGVENATMRTSHVSEPIDTRGKEAVDQDVEFVQLRRENELLQQIKLQEDEITAYDINTASLKRKLTENCAEQKELRELNSQYCQQLKEMVEKFKRIAEENQTLKNEVETHESELQRLREELEAAQMERSEEVQFVAEKEEDEDPHGLGQVLTSLRMNKERLRLENERLKKYARK